MLTALLPLPTLTAYFHCLLTMYRLHDALGHGARPSRCAHARRLGITPAGACSAPCSAHVATRLRRSFGRPAMEERLRVSAATTALRVAAGAAHGTQRRRDEMCRPRLRGRGGGGSRFRVFVSCCPYLSVNTQVCLECTCVSFSSLNRVCFAAFFAIWDAEAVFL